MKIESIVREWNKISTLPRFMRSDALCSLVHFGVIGKDRTSTVLASEKVFNDLVADGFSIGSRKDISLTHVRNYLKLEALEAVVLPWVGGKYIAFLPDCRHDLMRALFSKA